MPVVALAEEDERRAVAATVERWIAAQAGQGLLVAGERQEAGDAATSHRWHLRFRGEEKEVITLWLSLKQRTLHHEAQVMPAPEARVDETLRYLMRSNAQLFAMAFCLGPEDAVYLVGRVPAAQVDEAELDRIAGSSVHYIDRHFPTAMTLGHPRLYRRRRAG